MKQYILVLLFIAFTLPALAQDSWSTPTKSAKDKLEAELKIYPNPCKNSKVTIEFSAKEISEIRLINITGKQVLLKKYHFATHKTQLKLEDVPNGIYLIQIKTTDNKTTVKKLMVSKN